MSHLLEARSQRNQQGADIDDENGDRLPGRVRACRQTRVETHNDVPFSQQVLQVWHSQRVLLDEAYGRPE